LIERNLRERKKNKKQKRKFKTIEKMGIIRKIY